VPALVSSFEVSSKSLADLIRPELVMRLLKLRVRNSLREAILPLASLVRELPLRIRFAWERILPELVMELEVMVRSWPDWIAPELVNF